MSQYVCRIDDLMCWVCPQGSQAPINVSLSFPLHQKVDENSLLAEVTKRVEAKKITNFGSIPSPTPGTPFRFSK